MTVKPLSNVWSARLAHAFEPLIPSLTRVRHYSGTFSADGIIVIKYNALFKSNMDAMLDNDELADANNWRYIL